MDKEFNPIKGRCIHACKFCENSKGDGIRFDEKEMNTDLGKGNFIFVGSGTDMFANDVPDEWIKDTLAHCREYPENRYLFQSKNSSRFLSFLNQFPKSTILGTTVETNRENHTFKFSEAPAITDRVETLKRIDMPRMLTIEPVMEFDVEALALIVEELAPEFVNIGANSRTEIELPEPSKDDLKKLIARLEKLTKVNIKDNLKRLM